MIQPIKELCVNAGISLLIAFNPKYWFLRYPYSRAWDSHLRNRLKKGFEKKGNSLFLGDDIRVWVDDSPSSSFATFDLTRGCFVRPSRYTIVKAYYKISKT